MEKQKAPIDKPRRNDERERRNSPYQQIATDIAEPLAEFRVPSASSANGVSSVDGRTERNDEREVRNSPYQQIAADIAGPLADLRVPGSSNERTAQHDTRTSIDGRTENAMGNRQGMQAPQRNKREKKVPPYQQLAADIAQPLAELQVHSASNANGEAKASVDGRTQSENESRQGSWTGSKQEVLAGKKGGRQHYLDVAQSISGKLAGLRVPGTNDDRDFQRTATIQSQQEQVPECFPHQQSQSEYEPDASCGSVYEYESCGRASAFSSVEMPSEPHHGQTWASFSSQGETDSVPHQESFSEYNPDASCGSYGYETCGHSSGHDGVEMKTGQDYNEKWGSSEQVKAANPFPQQESLSEYNPEATCCSGYYDDPSSHSNLQLERGREENFLAGLGSREEAPSRSQHEAVECSVHQEFLSEYNKDATCGSDFYHTEFDSYTDHSNVQLESESFANNPETSRIASSPSNLTVETETDHSICAKDERNAQLHNCYTQPGGEPASKRSRRNPEMTDEQLARSVENTPLQRSSYGISSVESNHFESTGRATNNESGMQNSAANSRARKDEYLRYEFEQMNLDENNSAEVRGTTPAADSSMASVYSQGARPKTSQKAPKQKKHKVPKQNTKKAYAELAKDVAGDLAAMNAQLADTKTKVSRAANEQSSVRRQKVCDGSTLHPEKENNSSRYAFLVEPGLPDTEREPSLSNDVRRGRSRRSEDARHEMDDTSMTDTLQPASSSSPAFSRDAHTASRRARETRDAEELRRAQIEEQQRLMDNMGPELQAIVIQMMRQDEEELGGGHVLYGGNLNPPIPPRLRYQELRDNSSPGASVQGTSEQPGGKKSRKGKKKKGHYVELAGIIAPELAAVNKALMNGHSEGSAKSAESGRKREAADVADQGAAGYSPGQERVSRRGANSVITNGAHGSDGISRDELLRNGVSSREPTSLPQSSANRRQRRGNENRKPVASAYAMGKGPGKENLGQSQKQRKLKEDQNKSGCSLMAESMAASLQTLNARLEEQQRQQQRASKNRASSKKLEERSGDSVTGDTGGVFPDDSASSHDPSKNGYK